MKIIKCTSWDSYIKEHPSFTGCLIDKDNDKSYYLNGQRHKIDGPAIEWINGYKEYYINGQKHRIDGPAVEDTNGYKVWYLNGKEYTKKEFNKRGKHTKQSMGK